MSPPPLRPGIESLEVLFTPADFGTLQRRDLRRATCVVFDVLRATTSMVTALANGAAAVLPVADIPAALQWRSRRPEVLLAGEREGLRIRAAQSGGVDFDLGNSPREFTAGRVAGRVIVTTTTNGTRALRACAGAGKTLVGAFLNLGAVADWLVAHPPEGLIVVCSGTFEEAATEDVLAAGALVERLDSRVDFGRISDAARMARQVWEAGRGNLLEAVGLARNGARLLSRPELAADVSFSLRCDTTPIVAALAASGEVRVLPPDAGPPAAG